MIVAAARSGKFFNRKPPADLAKLSLRKPVPPLPAPSPPCEEEEVQPTCPGSRGKNDVSKQSQNSTQGRAQHEGSASAPTPVSKAGAPTAQFCATAPSESSFTMKTSEQFASVRACFLSVSSVFPFDGSQRQVGHRWKSHLTRPAFSVFRALGAFVLCGAGNAHVCGAKQVLLQGALFA